MDDLQYRRMNIFRKIIFVTVIVLLILLFIFFMRLGIRVNDVVDTDYDKNVSLMEEAARKYFTKDVIESDNMISLKKMYDLNLISELKTSDGESCIDIASFAKIKKVDDKYQLDIVLVCGNNNKKKSVVYEIS